MKIKTVEIQGFRAYKHKEDGNFDFTNGDDVPSNFVAIFAPNGFGKSSFYDAVEWAITGHIDRLGGEHNKQNHEFAAKSTKKQGIAQKILRNKDVGDEVATYVNVYTTLPQPFKQSLKKIRSDSRDLQIGNLKNAKNLYFRQILLSQDEISRFLREAKPQERYKRFMDSFGDGVENVRQQLTALINENNLLTETLKKTKAELEEKLNEPVNMSVFEQFNEIALTVNAESAVVPLLDSHFSEEQGHEVLAMLITRRHEFKLKLDSGEITRDMLESRLADIPIIQMHLELIAEQQPRLGKLKKAVINAAHYQELINSRGKILSELQEINNKFDELHYVNASSLFFLQSNAELVDAVSRETSLSKSHAEEIAALHELEESCERINVDLQATALSISHLRHALENCSVVYSEIDTHQAKVFALASEVAGHEVALVLDKAYLKIIEENLIRISSINITSSFLLNSDTSAFSFDNSKIKKLGDLSQNLVALDLQEKSIHKTQDSLAEQMGIHERLIATGLEYISLWPSSTCPLCQKNHDSHSSLRDNIESTDLLSTLSKENSRKLQFSISLKAEIESKIDKIVREAIDAQIVQSAAFRTQLSELGQSINTKEHANAKAAAEKQALEERLDFLRASVLQLPKEDFIWKIESDIERLKEKRNEHLVSKEGLARAVESKKNIVSEYNFSIKSLNAKVNTLSSDPTYQKVTEYIKKNAILPLELNKHCDTTALQLGKVREERRAVCQEMEGKSNVLQELMIADGTWIDFQELMAQKEKAQETILHSESIIKNFHESVNRFAGLQNEKSMDKIRAKLSESIDALGLVQQDMDQKVQNIDLLSELLTAAAAYVAHLSLRTALQDVEENISRHRRAGAALLADRDLVIEELKTLIKEFFHEELIDSIYKKIDPHPSFRKVEFRPDFETADRPGLNILLNEEIGEPISPILYFSTAQLNILSLSVFLAGALHARDDHGSPLDVIMIDDPIQSMDSINILATIDLLRSISLGLNKQIIVSTHDDNFFGLLQRKIPSTVLGSKFLRLEKFGRVVAVNPLKI